MIRQMKHSVWIAILLFTLVSLPAYAAGMQVVDVMPTMYNEQPAISIIFDQPIDVKGNYDELISIVKDVEGRGEQLRMKGIVDKGLQIIYYVGLENGVSYNVHVSEGLKGMNSSVTLGDGFSKSVKMPALQPSAWFSSPGMVLIPNDKAVLPVTVSNLETVLINFYRAPVNSSTYWFNQAANLQRYSGDIHYGLENYKLIASKSYNVGAVNKQLDINIDIPKEVFDEQGVYMAVMQYGGSYYQIPTATFIVSDLGLQIRKYRNDTMADIWVRSITTGEPIAGVKVKAIYDDNDMDTADEVTTDAKGYAQLDMSDGSPQLVVANQANQYAIVNMGRALDFSEFSIGGDAYRNTQIYVYGPRDLYRGGETARWNILVRNHDAKAVNQAPIGIKVTNPRGQVVENITTPLDREYGYAKYSLILPDTAPTGTWNIVVTAGSTAYTHRFAVEDFMPETMRLTLGKPGEPLIVPKETATKLVALGEYLYGAPAAQNRIEGHYSVRPASFISDKWQGYYFAADRQELRGTGYLESSYLDDKGMKTWDISGNSALNIDKQLIPVRIQYQMTMYESGGRAINRSKEYVYLPTGEAIGIKPSFNDYASTDGDNIFSIININTAGEAVPAKVALTLLKEERSYYWEYSSNYGWRYNYTSATYPVQRRELDLTNKATDIPLRMDWGYYKLEVKNLNTGQTNTHNFEAGSWWYDSGESGLSTKPESLTIMYDKPAYMGGDTAKISITSPYDGKGSLLVENSDGVLWSTNIEVKNQKAQVNLPIGRGWDRHDIYVSAYITRPESELEKTQKGLVFGINHLRLDRRDRNIPLKVVHPDSVEPGKDFEVVVSTTERDKFGSKALVTLAAVDQGILSLRAFKTPDAGAYFFRKLGYPVLVLDNFWQVVHKYSDKMATRYGGDAVAEMAQTALQRGGALARADVKIVSIFTEPITFDGKGEAKIMMNIPSFNGELRMMALAFSADSYGKSESTMKVAEPIITELNMPRFIATGDKITLAMDMQNMTGADQDLTVTVTTANGLKLSDGTFSLKVKVEKGNKHILQIPVEATGTAGYSEISVNVKGYKEEINKKWRLAVRPPYPAVTTSKFFTIEPGSEVSLFTENLANYIIDSAYFGLSISALPPLNIEQHLRYLLMYPYGCLEQTTSSTFPLLYATQEVRQRFGLTLPEGHTQEELVAEGIRMLLSKQLSNGGFGYWDASSYESQWGTVYAAELLNEAAKLGFTVNQNALNNANNRLANYVRNGVSSQYNGYYDRQDHFSLSVQAYAAYVLSKYGKASLADVREVYSRMTKSGINKSIATQLPALHIAVALKNAGDPARAAEAMKTLRAAEWMQQWGYYGDYSSNIRDKAWAIKLLSEYMPLSGDEIAERLVDLSGDIGARSWMSTQERLRLFQAAIDIKSTDGVQGSVTANGKTTPVDEPEAYINSWSATSLSNGVKYKSDSESRVYAMAEFSAYSKNAPAVLEQNAYITRNYYDTKGKKIDIANVKVGDYVVVELEFGAQKNTADGLVIDLLPAGFEIENQNLDNSLKLNSVNRPSRNTPGILYSEYRDDRFIQAVSIYSGRKQSSWYIMRAVTPGNYTNPTPYFEDMYRSDVRAIGKTTPARINILPQ